MPVNRAQLGISPSFAVWVGVVWCVFICDGAGFSYVLRHYDPRFVYLNQHASMVRSDLLCTYIPVAGALLAIAGLLARRWWGWSLAMLLNLALVAGCFAVAGTAPFWSCTSIRHSSCAVSGAAKLARGRRARNAVAHASTSRQPSRKPFAARSGIEISRSVVADSR